MIIIIFCFESMNLLNLKYQVLIINKLVLNHIISRNRSHISLSISEKCMAIILTTITIHQDHVRGLQQCVSRSTALNIGEVHGLLGQPTIQFLLIKSHILSIVISANGSEDFTLLPSGHALISSVSTF